MTEGQPHHTHHHPDSIYYEAAGTEPPKSRLTRIMGHVPFFQNKPPVFMEHGTSYDLNKPDPAQILTQPTTETPPTVTSQEP